MIKILAIDDSKSVHAFLKHTLQTYQIEITSCFNGQEAVEHLKQTNQTYDLILLDWEMPVKDGPSTINELKKMERLPPIVMMTSRNSIEDIEKILQLGVSEYIMKPYTKDILIGKLSLFLDVLHENAG